MNTGERIRSNTRRKQGPAKNTEEEVEEEAEVRRVTPRQTDLGEAPFWQRGVPMLRHGPDAKTGQNDRRTKKCVHENII